MDEVVFLFGNACTSSRYYLVKYFKILTTMLQPRINVFSNLKFKSHDEYLELNKNKKTFTIVVAGPQ